MSNCFRYYRIFSKVIKREAKIKIKFLSVEYFGKCRWLYFMSTVFYSAFGEIGCAAQRSGRSIVLFVVKVPEKSPAGV
jgi:hypothetical protein